MTDAVKLIASELKATVARGRFDFDVSVNEECGVSGIWLECPQVKSDIRGFDRLCVGVFIDEVAYENAGFEGVEIDVDNFVFSARRENLESVHGDRSDENVCLDRALDRACDALEEAHDRLVARWAAEALEDAEAA